MGVALLGFAQSKKNVSNRKSFIHTFGKVCAKFRGYLKICRHISINDWTIRIDREMFSSVRYHVWRLKTVRVVVRGGHSSVDFLELLKAFVEEEVIFGSSGE